MREQSGVMCPYLSGGYMGINICQNPLNHKFRICAFHHRYDVPQKINKKQQS